MTSCPTAVCELEAVCRHFAVIVSSICAAGLLQLVFTVVVLVVFIPIFHSFWLGLLWQVCFCCPPTVA